MSNMAKKNIEATEASEAAEVDFKGAGRGKSKHADKRLKLPLSGVRTAVEKTQVQVASASGIDQGDVSRIERRALDDIELKTLRRYLAALGAKLELVAVVGASRITLRDPGE